MKKTALFLALSCMTTGSAFAAAFVNGGFEDGNIGSWNAGGGTSTAARRNGVSNANLVPSDWLPGGSHYDASNSHSAIINTGAVDPVIGAALGTTVYTGNHSYRVEDTTNGGYASAISQTVANYTDANIFFAWKAVLENGGHADNSSAAMFITLRDDTDGIDVISRFYNAGNGGGGVDANFAQQGNHFYTPTWQIEQLAIDASLSGHDFTLTVLAADCQPTGHEGYVYLDGFGAVIPPVTTVPEPATLALLGLGLAGISVSRRRKAA
jgi:hypothetical protein